MRISLVLAAALLLVGAGCDDVSKLNNESTETKPEVQENNQMVNPEVKTDDSLKSDDGVKTDDNSREESKKVETDDRDNEDSEEADDDNKNVVTQPTTKPAETKPVITPPPTTKPVVTVTPVTTGPKTYTMAEVQAQAAAGKCWTVINGGVYNLTAWINQHPGGSAAIKSLCGINGTAKFQAIHGGQARPESVLKSYYLGALK